MVLYLYKIINIFYPYHIEKPTATSLPINPVTPMPKSIAKLKPNMKTLTNQKYYQSTKVNSNNKCVKMSWAFSFCLGFYFVSIVSKMFDLSHVIFSYQFDFLSIIWQSPAKLRIFIYLSVFPLKYRSRSFSFYQVKVFSIFFYLSSWELEVFYS